MKGRQYVFLVFFASGLVLATCMPKTDKAVPASTDTSTPIPTDTPTLAPTATSTLSPKIQTKQSYQLLDNRIGGLWTGLWQPFSWEDIRDNEILGFGLKRV